jgi:hypothetical protein
MDCFSKLRPRQNFVFTAFLLSFFWAAGMNVCLVAQELRAQPTPLTAWLDLRAAQSGAAPQTVPEWVQAFEFIERRETLRGTNALLSGFAPLSSDAFGSAEHPRGGIGNLEPEEERAMAAKAFFRIRVQKPAGASEELQLRIFFEDRPARSRVRVTAWNELGAQLMRSAPLGQGLDLPSSESLVVRMKGVDYLEIEAPGDGGQLRGAFLTWLTKTRVRQSADFPSGEAVRDPFQALPKKSSQPDDAYLYGVVTASIQKAPLKLQQPSAPSASFEFELERQPLVAVVTYEVLGATVSAPPSVTVNGNSLGPSDLVLPHLADPAYRGEARQMDPQMTFRYTGWLRGQKVIPGALLVGGLNNLKLEMSNGSDPIAVRSIEIQLKYNWEKFDYILSPAPTPPSP